MLLLEPRHEEEIDRLLTAANGRRTARTLERLDVLKSIEEAMQNGFALRTGGSVDDARAQSTLCVVVRTERGVTVGIGAARGAQPEPGQLWPALDRWIPDGTARCLQRAHGWARKVKDRFVEIPLGVTPAVVPNTDAALLGAVMEQPDSKERRQIYGDLLLGQGDPRGELISVQLQLEAMEKDDEGRKPLEEREVILRAGLEKQWRERFQDHVIHLEYRRGFVERAVLHASAFFQGVDALLEAEPVRELRLVDLSPDDVPRLVMAPWLGRLTALELMHLQRSDRRRALNTDDLGRLLDTERLRGLTRLVLSGHMIDDTGVMVFSHNVPFTLPKLQQLTIARDELTPVGIGVMVEHSWLQRLTQLDLSGNHLGVGGTTMVATSVSQTRLRELDLGANLLGDEGARVLAGAQRLAGLEQLGLRANHIGPYGAKALLDSEGLSGVKRWNLDGNRVGSVAAKRLQQRSTNELMP